MPLVNIGYVMIQQLKNPGDGDFPTLYTYPVQATREQAQKAMIAVAEETCEGVHQTDPAHNNVRLETADEDANVCRMVVNDEVLSMFYVMAVEMIGPTQTH